MNPLDSRTGQTRPGDHPTHAGAGLYSAQPQQDSTPILRAAARPHVPADRLLRDTHEPRVGGDPEQRGDQVPADNHRVHVAAPQLVPDQVVLAALGRCVGGARPPEPASAPIAATADGTDLRDDQSSPGVHATSVVADQQPHPASEPASPIPSPPGGVSSSGDQTRSGTHGDAVAAARDGQNSDHGHVLDTVAGHQQPPPTIGGPAPSHGSSAAAPSSDTGQTPVGSHMPPAGIALDSQDRAQASCGDQPTPGPVLADPFLALAADVLDDLERVRIANENRLRQLTRAETDSDGEERGFGLTLEHPDVKRLAALVDGLVKAEHDATLNLNRLMRRHPLGPWVKQARGVGEKQAARLLAAIGDPWWNDLHDRPRTVSELWSYCGYHVLSVGYRVRGDQTPIADGAAGGGGDQRNSEPHARSVGVAATRARGQKANWSATAKMRAYLVATSIVKAGGSYREVYDEGRAKYGDAVHAVECRRCGPAGKPALAGSALSDGHKHARAIRLVSKAVLKDLWREAKRLHELHDGQGCGDTQPAAAVVAPTPGGHVPVEDHVPAAAGPNDHQWSTAADDATGGAA